uniref:Holin n=2 Tax=Aromatoleum anaerobium TaxID=182180 RepID=A0ABX1PQX1_9RHOO
MMPAAPPVGVAGMSWMGVPLADWVLIATLIYTGVQIVIVLPRAIAVVRGWVKRT